VLVLGLNFYVCLGLAFCVFTVLAQPILFFVAFVVSGNSGLVSSVLHQEIGWEVLCQALSMILTKRNLTQQKETSGYGM